MNDAVIGLWRLVAARLEDLDTGVLEDPYGTDPLGYLLMAPGGRILSFLTSKEPTGYDPVTLFNSMMAYSGTYKIDGDRWITDVDIAWFPGWVGTQQVRSFTVSGDDLHVRGGPFGLPARPGRRIRAILQYHREDKLGR
jgi:hypothetical protein